MSNPYNDVLNELKTIIADKIDEVHIDAVDDGNMQNIIDVMYEEHSNRELTGVVLDFLFAVPHSGDTRGPRDRWDLFIGGLGIIRFFGPDETESAKVQLVSRLMNLFNGEHTKVLTNADKATITRIDRPRKTKVGEHTFYFVPFTIKVNYGGK